MAGFQATILFAGSTKWSEARIFQTPASSQHVPMTGPPMLVREDVAFSAYVPIVSTYQYPYISLYIHTDKEKRENRDIPSPPSVCLF